MKIKKLTQMAMLTAIALTIFMVEAQIPALVPVPGVKLGLSNIVTVFAVFVMGPKEAASILFVRIFLGAVFAGNFSTIFYSAAGGALAIVVTILLRKVLTEKQLWVAGVMGAIAHSAGQMAMAVAITQTVGLVAYLPMMIICSIITGLFTGLCAQLLVNRGKDWWISSIRRPSAWSRPPLRRSLQTRCWHTFRKRSWPTTAGEEIPTFMQYQSLRRPRSMPRRQVWKRSSVPCSCWDGKNGPMKFSTW